MDAIEQRVLGALLEKEQTTPDYYPLTVKALLAACNQKSNRSPVMALQQGEVEDALERLRKDVLVWRSSGARAVRWEHRVDQRWQLDSARKAVMTLLLVRGPQTPGELRSRSERMHGFASTREVEETLSGLAAGSEPLVIELEREPGQRENRWRHLLDRETEDDVAEGRVGRSPASEAASVPGMVSSSSGGRDVEARVEALEERVRELERLVERLEQLRRQLE